MSMIQRNRDIKETSQMNVLCGVDQGTRYVRDLKVEQKLIQVKLRGERTERLAARSGSSLGLLAHHIIETGIVG